MKIVKTHGYANGTPQINIHVYGFSSVEARDKMAEELKEVIRRFRRIHKEKNLERKITLD